MRDRALSDRETRRNARERSAFPRSRVEDGRGGLSLLAIAPFPIPAHQTGRADFPHPAFRLDSSHVIRPLPSLPAYLGQG